MLREQNRVVVEGVNVVSVPCLVCVSHAKGKTSELQE